MASTRSELPATQELTALVAELRATYLTTSRGAEHVRSYEEERRIAIENFETALAMEAAGKDLTDWVLLKLLPHNKNRGNLERGAWISHAPVIKKDIRQWFEGAGWTKPGDWPLVAGAIWRLIKRCNEDPSALGGEVSIFSDDPRTKGLQAGFLSPILHALRPESFALVNSKSRKALAWATGTNYGPDLRDFPRSNQAMLEFVRANGRVFDLPDLTPIDAFDLFSHFLIGIKRLTFGNSEDGRWEELATWAGRFFEQESFDTEERNYKLQIAENLRAARAAFQGGSEWLAPLKKALGPPNNLTGWQLNDTFIKWCGSSPGQAAAALAAVWSSDLDPPGRLSQFFELLPKGTISAPGGRIALASLLHMAMEPTAYPIFRATPFKEGYGLTGYPHPPKGASELEVYEHALGFLDRLIEETAKHDVALRDRLDAQGLLWTITRAREEAAAFMPEEERARFYSFVRGGNASPRYWKIAPGESAWQWEESLAEGFIAIGWDFLDDLEGVTKEEFDELAQSAIAGGADFSAHAQFQVWSFCQIRPGDRVVANRGTTEVLGIGTVIGPYYFVPEATQRHRFPIRWDDTRVRRVAKPGWQRTLIELKPPEFEELAGLAMPEPNRDVPAFSSAAFELLERLAANPTKETYLERREEYRAQIEAPLAQLFKDVVGQLPAGLVGWIETEKNVQSRFLKNDYGRGGVWPFLWAAVYPKGSSRVEGAQLFMSVEPELVDSGFFVAHDKGEDRERFERNMKRLLPELAPRLEALWGGLDLSFGRKTGVDQTRYGSNAQAWLKALAGAGDYASEDLRAGRPWPRARVVETPRRDLAAAIAKDFQALLPLLLLSLLEDPADEIRGLLRAIGDAPDEIREPPAMPPPPRPLAPEVPLARITATTHIPESRLSDWVQAIERKGQAIIYGPPGTGKTFVAGHLAGHLIGGGDGFVELLQFHPSYAYEDFIQGLRPVPGEGGSIRFEVIQGRFLEFCERAEAVTGRCVLILDEINRANLSRVFGELMYLLEYRGEIVPLAGGGNFSIPENVRILGTMNTADRSIALVDHALRRRFAFLSLQPEYGVLREHFKSAGCSAESLIALLTRLNGAIGDANHSVGISFFLVSNPREALEHIWRMEIEPYLEEYFFDQSHRLKEFRWEEVSKGLVFE